MYAPTSTHDDEEEKLYDEIDKLLQTKTQYTILMGDFNGKVGKRVDEEDAVGEFGSGERNERGERVVEFATAQNLKIMNTCFQKSFHRKWTWRSPNGKVFNVIDYILTDKPSLITNVTTINRANIGSDHRMLLCTMKIDTKYERNKLSPYRYRIRHHYFERKSTKIPTPAEK